MNPLIQSLTEGQLRTDIPSFRPGDTVRVHAKVVEGNRERIQIFEVLLSHVKVLVSQKTTQFVKSLTVQVLSVSSQSTLHVLKRSKLFVTVKYVVRNCTTCVHFKVRQLVSKKSVVNSTKKLCLPSRVFLQLPQFNGYNNSLLRSSCWFDSGRGHLNQQEKAFDL